MVIGKRHSTIGTPPILSHGTGQFRWSAFGNDWLFCFRLYNQSPVRKSIVTNDRWGKGTLCSHGDFYTCSDRYSPGILRHRNLYEFDLKPSNLSQECCSHTNGRTQWRSIKRVGAIGPMLGWKIFTHQRPLLEVRHPLAICCRSLNSNSQKYFFQIQNSRERSAAVATSWSTLAPPKVASSIRSSLNVYVIWANGWDTMAMRSTTRFHGNIKTTRTRRTFGTRANCNQRIG